MSSFMEDPLGWLTSASRVAPVAIVSRAGPVLSRDDGAVGAVAAFGPAVRRVLGNTDIFGMPMSISRRHHLPPTLVNLNTALFSMSGARHRSRQQMLAQLLGPASDADHTNAIDRAIDEFLQIWSDGREIRLIDQMRRLARLVAQQILFGTGDEADNVGVEIQRYFELRRQYASPIGDRDSSHLDALVEQGTRVDVLLRARVRAELRRGLTGGNGIFGRLCRLTAAGRIDLSDDELVAHASVLFMSSSEPIATAMTWIMLALIQHPRVGAVIRAQATDAGMGTQALRGVVREVLRLVPPSAIMVRLTTREVVLAGARLPTRCEVIISPFAEHRRPEVFAEPDRFRPQRWLDARLDGFPFMPFGTGTRTCLGRRIALATLERSTAALLAAAEPALTHSQRLDWRMNVTLAPVPDPLIRLTSAGRVGALSSQLSGPASDLIH